MKLRPGKKDGEMRSTYARGVAFLSGETVTAGDFRCRECGYEHRAPDDKATNLPVCPRCQNDTWDSA